MYETMVKSFNGLVNTMRRIFIFRGFYFVGYSSLSAVMGSVRGQKSRFSAFIHEIIMYKLSRRVTVCNSTRAFLINKRVTSVL